MKKIAKRYLEVLPFGLKEVGFHKERSRVSESLFSLSNEYHGIRAFFEEDYSGETLHGSYFNGIYEYALKDTPSAYKGIVKRTHFMINSVNYLKTRIKYKDEVLDLNKIKFKDFERTLDFKSGEYVRSFVWQVEEGEIKLTFKRFLSMNDFHRAYQKIEITSNFDAKLNVSLSLDSNVLHWGDHCYYDNEKEEKVDDSTYLLNIKTPTTNQKVVSIMKVSLKEPISYEIKDKEIIVNYLLDCKKNEPLTIERYVVNLVDKKGRNSFEELNKLAKEEVEISFNETYKKALNKNKDYWNKYFNEHDIEIKGDPLNQQGIRYCLFQLESTYHGVDPENNIGAKGLTGEAYSGHTFWDTETYCLSYYLLNNIEASKNLLLYRYNTLKQAKARAKELDCEGACFPIATLNGEESCNLWQHASTQFQPTTGVAYAIFHYFNLTHDLNFIKDYGYEMLIEISKFLLSRGDYTSDGSGFGFFGVMGPDEFQLMVNQNTYTNFMAKKSFELLLKFKDLLETKELRKIEEKCQICGDFYEKVKDAADKMIILYDKKTHLFEQHDGFFKLPHIDINSIPDSDFPLYYHWSYDRIYRNDMIKQPDVLMFLFLFNQMFSLEDKKANYEFYEPKTIHESSLSPSVHSILANEIGKEKEAIDFFGFATRLDLDDYNNNTCEGIHTTSISAAWSNIVYGFGGVRTDGELLVINPSLPKQWDGYSFYLTYFGSKIKVEVNKEKTVIKKISGKDIELIYKGKKVVLKDEIS